MSKVIGIFGGTFDPIHLGHLSIAEQLLGALPLREVRFLPCYQPVHRGEPGASATQRMEMIQMALQGKEHYKIYWDDRELQRKEPSYMIDTMRELREEFTHEPFALIIGMDAFINLPSWKDWGKLVTLCHFIVVGRPDIDNKPSEELAEFIERHQTKNPDMLTETLDNPGCIYFATIEPINISATKIRECVRAGESVEAMVDSGVGEYIRDNKLYLA